MMEKNIIVLPDEDGCFRFGDYITAHAPCKHKTTFSG
ncbi:hypothetical protein SAAL107622_10900 [Lacicoccus alkaliphilus]